MERLEIMVHSIHYHDVVRWFMGEPESVYAMAGRTPGSSRSGDPHRELLSLRGCQRGRAREPRRPRRRQLGGVPHRRRERRHPWNDRAALDYPSGRPDTRNLQLVVADRRVGSVPDHAALVPHAFIGTMGAVLDAIAAGLTPRSSARDNVKTVRLVDALYRSMDLNQVVLLGSGQHSACRSARRGLGGLYPRAVERSDLASRRRHATACPALPLTSTTYRVMRHAHFACPDRALSRLPSPRRPVPWSRNSRAGSSRSRRSGEQRRARARIPVAR